MFARILEQRIRPIVEPTLSPQQFGFRKGKGCTDAIFALRQISEKTIEYKNQMNIAFIDQEKAFDRVNREILWDVLENYGIKGTLLDCVRAIYIESESAIRTSAGLTNWFPVTSGVRQGCVLSPLLFIIYMDSITKIDDTSLDVDQQNELLFADDQCLFHNNIEQLQDHINLLNNSCLKYNMKINIQKTEVMTISREHKDINIQINDQTLKQVREFKYLGSIFTSDSRMDREIETRIQQANNITYQLTPILKHPAIPVETKRQIINAIFIPTLCYQGQTWALTKEQERKITTCEMRCLRKAVNKTRRDHVRNEDIRRTVGTTPAIRFIEKQRLKWFGHLVRMNPNTPVARAYNLKMESSRGRGRPRKRWVDGVTDILKLHNTTTYQATERALSRKPIIS